MVWIVFYKHNQSDLKKSFKITDELRNEFY